MCKPNEHGIVLILSANDWQKKMIMSELLRLDPSLTPDADGNDSCLAEVSDLTDRN